MEQRRSSKQEANQYISFANAYIRRQMHELGPDNKSIYDAWFDRLAIKPSDCVLDIGTGRGYDMIKFVEKYQASEIVGLEPPIDDDETEEEFQIRHSDLERVAQEKGIDNISMRMGYANHLPFEPASFDIITMLHSIYHFDYPMGALRDAQRVLKDDGDLLIVTNGAGNRARLHEFLQDMAKHPALQAVAPKPFSSSFNFKRAETIIPLVFDVVHQERYLRPMIITENTLPLYLLAVDTYRPSFEPKVMQDGSWHKARKEVVEDTIRQEMAGNDGIFLDTIDIGALFCKKQGFVS